MSTQPQLILASASPRRREILATLGLRFEVDPSSSPEPPPGRGEAPGAYAVRLARLKARSVAARYRSGWVMGADTVVVVGGSLLGKPADDADARRMLRKLGGRWHEVVTGVCLIDAGSGRSAAKAAVTRVHFRRLTSDEIGRYVRTGEPMDKAGAYAIQGRAAMFADRIEGCYFNIVGFPVAAFFRLCRRAGLDLPSLQS
jgi:septum formation protein